MFEFAGNKKIALMLVPVGLAFSISASVVHADGHGGGKFVTGGASGEGVKTRFGECWRAKGGTTGVDPCAPKMEKMMDGDSDGDGVPDSKDQCPNTPKGVSVDSVGCPLDSDGDGVPDYRDNCPGTPSGTKVDANGCAIMGDVTVAVTADHFAFDSAELKPKMQSVLNGIADKVRMSPGSEQLHIVGHTDSTGPEAYNQALSERRAQAAADYLAGLGVTNVTVQGMGESSPVADNSTREGRAMNRRVEILTK